MFVGSELLICDLDGTLIKRDLGLEFRRWLLETRNFGHFRALLAILFSPLNSISRKIFSRGSILSAWSSFRNTNDCQELMRLFIREKHSSFSLSEEVLSEVNSFQGERILLSGSETDLISLLLDFKGIEVFDRIIGSETTFFGIVFSQQPYGKGKNRFGPAEVSIGNSWPDRFLLNSSMKAIVVKGEKRLTKLASKKGWEIIG